MFNKSKINIKHKISAIVLAAGNGSRMNSDVKKQFITINDKPIIYYSLRAIEQCDLIDEIILVTSYDDIIYMQDIVKTYEFSKVAKIVPGGSTRQLSVFNGLNEVADYFDFVLIHDGVRPLIEHNDIINVINDGIKFGAAALGVPVKDTIKEVDNDGFVTKTLERSKLIAVQTPQIIKKDLLIKGYNENFNESFTDDISIIEFLGIKPKITIGNYSNIKVTTYDDLVYIKDLI